jgi:aspartyl/asparaginyl beta-hydroxylase (cupin superfamily)
MCDGVVGQALYIKLPAGKIIDPHEDGGDYLYHTCRHHIPIITNPGVGFFIDGETQHMKEGECWEINNNKTHAVFNKGETDRVHLLIDIIPRKVLG